MKVPYSPSVSVSETPAFRQREPDMSGIARGLGAISDAAETVGQTMLDRQNKLERFQALSDYSEYVQKNTEAIEQLKHDTTPTDPSLFARAAEITAKNRDALMAKIPPRLVPEFDYRWKEHADAVHGSVFDYRLKQQDEYSRVGISKAIDNGKTAVAQDPTVRPLVERSTEETIDASTLPPAEKELAKQQARREYRTIDYTQAKRAELDVGPDMQAYLARTMQIESNSGRDTSNPKSSVWGNFQWLDSTAAKYGISRGASKSQELIAAAKFTRDNARVLGNALGRPPTWAELYLAHQQGAGGAAALLLHPTDRAVDVVGKAQVLNNGGNVNMTAGQFANMWTSKFDRTQPADLKSFSVDNDPTYNDVLYEDRLSATKQAETNFNQEQNDIAKANKEQLAARQNDIYNGLLDGSMGRPEFDKAIEAGLFPDVDSKEKGLRILKQREDDVSLGAKGIAKFAAGEYWDPSDSNDRKMFNAVYDTLDGEKRLSARDQNFVVNGIIPLAEQAQDLPTKMVSKLGQMTRGADNRDMLFALDTLHQLEQAFPEAYQQRVPETLRKSVDEWAQNKDRPMDELAGIIRGGDTPEQRAIIDRLQGEAKKLINNRINEFNFTDLSKAITGQGIVSRMIHGAPLNYTHGWDATQFETEFQKFFEEEYPKYRDYDKTMAATVKFFAGRWGVTQVGTPNLFMKHPMEQSYGPNSAWWINEEVHKRAGLPIDARIEPISDDRTEREIAQKQMDPNAPYPSYVMQPFSPSGEPLPAFRWGANDKPDYVKQQDEQDFHYNSAVKEYRDFMVRVYGPADQMKNSIPIPQEIKDQKAKLEQRLEEQKKNLRTITKPDYQAVPVPEATGPFGMPVPR